MAYNVNQIEIAESWINQNAQNMQLVQNTKKVSN